MEKETFFIGKALNQLKRGKKVSFTIIVTLTVVIGSIMTGCGKKSSDQDKSSKESMSMEQVKQEAKDLVHALKTYSFEQKDEAIERTKTALGNLDSHIDSLETRMEKNWDNMDEQVRKETRANLKTLRQQRTKMAELYDNLKNSSADSWDHVKKGFSDAYEALSEAVKKTEKEFRSDK